MKRIAALLAVVLLLAAAAPATAQVTIGPVHHSIAIVGTGMGSLTLIAALNRRLLGLINDSSNVIYCTVDGVDAAVNTGIRLAAAGTTGDRVIFDRYVPNGALKCIAATGGSRLLIIDGR